MEEDNISGAVVPDFKDLESKLGRKVPDSLVRSLAERSSNVVVVVESGKTQETPNAHRRSAALERLEGKMLFLKQEMVSDQHQSQHVMNAQSSHKNERSNDCNRSLLDHPGAHVSQDTQTRLKVLYELCDMAQTSQELPTIIIMKSLNC